MGPAYGRPAYIRSKSKAMQDTYTTTPAPAARPTLLTVICIISFIMGAWGIFSGIQNLTVDQEAALQKARETMEEQRAQMGSQAEGMAGRFLDSAMEVAERTAIHAKELGIASIVLSLLSVAGVWMMWNLRKNGFWLYLLASIAGLVVPLMLLGGGMVALMSMGIGAFFTLLFIILYAVNLKYMH